MPDGYERVDRRHELVEVIHRVRNRWRLKRLLRGVVIVLAGTLLALMSSAAGLEALKFSPGSILAFRALALIIFGSLVYFGLFRPMRRRVSDSQVALYLEERDRSLETAILSAVESASQAAEAGDSDKGPSPRLVERLVEQAIDRCRAIDHGIAVEREALRRQIVALVAVVGAAALLVALGPAFIRHGLSALLIVSRSAEAASPYHIEVEPGNTKVPRGADQPVKARLLGFAASDAALMMRSDPAASFDRVPLVRSKDSDAFEGVLFHIEKTTEYYVESNGVRSPAFSMTVVDLPTVDRLVLEYHFPAYTGLQPRIVDPGGDVAALRGTEVRLRVSPTMKTPAGRVLLDDGGSAPLVAEADGTLAGRFKVDKEGFYRIELDGPRGEQVNASPQYTIDVLTDQTPAVSFAKPGRDTTATPVEEVLAEVRADDDFGVKQVQLFYSVNGGAEKTISLFGGSKTLQEVTASHTIYLEELGLKAGDFVSYYAKATDNNAVQGAQTATSDIYFVEIRPFRRDYKPAQSMAGGGGGGGAGQEVGQLSRQQREIVSATFNIVRDRPKLKAEKFREDAVFLTLAQARLREQVEELSEKMNSRLDVVDPAFKTIAEALPKAAAEMKLAEADLKLQKAKEALSPEQRALKLLQDAEQQYELQVSQQRGGGGGGGGQNQMAEDLADLFELELDKLANQYEMQQRAEQQGGDRQVDELAEKLKELARRQQQEAERQRRLSAQAGGGSGGGGDQQRQLAQEVEEAARRLQQLQREQPRQDISDAVRQLQQAANAMRQAAANGQDGGAQAQAALEALRRAQERLQQNQSGRGERDLQEVQRQAKALTDEQRGVEAAVRSLDQEEGAGRQSRTQALQQQKDAMDKKVADLQDQIEKLANETRGENRNAARKLDEAAGSITDKRIREMIRYTRNTLQGQANEYARAIEAQIGSNLEGLQQKLADAASAFGQASKDNAQQRALEDARNLVRRGESIDQRLRDRAQQRSQQGQEGQDARGQDQGEGQGQEGQQGQGGQEGQGGESGQQGGASASSGAAGGAAGGPRTGGWGGDARNWNGGYGGWGAFTPDDIRQFRSELREWQNDAQALRQQLTEAGLDARELDAIMRQLRELDSEQVFADPRNLAALQANALEKLKNFEFNLRQKAQGDNQPLSLSGSEEVPAGFRTQIEEYFRSLARRPGAR
jgi:hypothetical protein